MPKFSIIVPVYKIEAYLEQCVHSILKQSYQNFELILVDDGSPDRCPEICDDFAKQDRRVKVIHKKNGGLVSARAAGVSIAEGKYLGYVDGDDWIEPELLMVVSRILDTNDDIDIINFNFFNNINGIAKPNSPCRFVGLYEKKQLEQEVYPNMLYDFQKKFYSFGVIPAVWCKFYKKELLVQNLCTNEKITFGEDVACVYQAMLQANTMFFCNEYLYHYRRNRQSMTKAYNERLFEQCAELLEYLHGTLITQSVRLEKQVDEYTVFVLLKCVLNEARANDGVSNMKKRLVNRMNCQNWYQFIQNIDVSSYPIPYKVFFWLLKCKCYTVLLWLSNLMLKLYR